MPADYATLAPIYDTLGMAAQSEALIPGLLDFAQRNEWMGRRVLDLGCGTGAALIWLARRGYVVAGLDTSAEMLRVAQARAEAASLNTVSAQFRQGDIRRLDGGVEYDLALALNVLNEMESLRDVEAVFMGAHKSLAEGRMFIFSVETLEGLAAAAVGHDAEQILFDDHASLTVAARAHYDYERQALTRSYLIFRRDGGVVGGSSDGWTRYDTQVVARGYPITALASLAGRCGFDVLAALTPELTLYEPGASARQLFFVTVRR
jgi:2-polyprenyl-3-methyl-5-hydroxy-6-metoxy-1,4-benzoquinol methylase